MILGMLTAWIFILTLAFCDPGQRVTNQFDEFSEELSRCDWYAIPIEMQRIFLIFLSDTQQPKNVQTYNSILCTRETFKKVRQSLQMEGRMLISIECTFCNLRIWIFR